MRAPKNIHICGEKFSETARSDIDNVCVEELNFSLKQRAGYGRKRVKSSARPYLETTFVQYLFLTRALRGERG